MNLNVPPRFAGATIKSWRERTHNDAVADVMDAYVANAEQHFLTGRGLLLLGPPGVGKTYLVCAVLCALDKRYDVRFVTMPRYIRVGLQLMTLREQWSQQGDDEAYETWKRITKEVERLRNKYDFVAMDDVGMEHNRTTSHWSEDEFQMWIRSRFDLALPSLLTSNHELEEWSTIYGPAMRSFVKEAFIIVSLAGDDLR